jgi:hypothetical protein
MSTNAVAAVQKDQDIRGFLQTLVDSKKLPAHVKSVEEAFTVAQMGRELGFPTMQSFHYIIPIQGRLTLSAKAVNALLRKGGVTFQTLEDGLYVYGDGKTAPTEYPLADPKPVDRRTTIEFTRDGIKEKTSFTWRDAEGQGLTSKDNWKRMPKEMLYARCLAKGANRIGADLLLGLYMSEEITDSFNIKEAQIKRYEDGTIESVTEDAEAVIVK